MTAERKKAKLICKAIQLRDKVASAYYLEYGNDGTHQMMRDYRKNLVKELNDLGYTFDSCYKPLHIAHVTKLLKDYENE